MLSRLRKPYNVTFATALQMLILSWNLFHGRSQPPARRALLQEFAAKLAAWQWDVALLQEVPPWWPPVLAREAGAGYRSAMTSRNVLLAPRRAVADRRPELIKSNGGGCNAILSRRPIAGHAALRMRVWPERRVAQFVRLGDATCVVNYHASTRAVLAQDELRRLSEHALRWAAGDPLILGGDLNLRKPLVRSPALAHVASGDVDHIFAQRFARTADREALDRCVALAAGAVALSDHPPLRAQLRAAGARVDRTT